MVFACGSQPHNKLTHDTCDCVLAFLAREPDSAPREQMRSYNMRLTSRVSREGTATGSFAGMFRLIACVP